MAGSRWKGRNRGARGPNVRNPAPPELQRWTWCSEFSLLRHPPTIVAARSLRRRLHRSPNNTPPRADEDFLRTPSKLLSSVRELSPQPSAAPSHVFAPSSTTSRSAMHRALKSWAAARLRVVSQRHCGARQCASLLSQESFNAVYDLRTTPPTSS